MLHLMTVSEAWRAEMDNRFELEQIGISRGTFRPGDAVIISGSPGRSQALTLYLWRLERPADRLRYQQVGGSPSIDKGGPE
jgi:thiamine monophosphate kinase